MEINQLRLFRKIAVTEHMTKAAAELQVAQPALSKTVRQLETELGFTLFDRVGKNIYLNDNGRILLKHANIILNELEDARIEIQEANKLKENEVVLSMQAASKLLPDLISGFRQQHPQVKISIVQSDGSQGRKWDVCITSSRNSKLPANSKRLLNENILLAVPVEHRLASRESIRLEEVAKENFISLRKGSGLRDITDDYCLMAGFTPNVVLESDNPSTIRDLLQLGIGISLIPEVSWKGDADDRIRLMQISRPSCKRCIYLLSQNRSYTPRAVELFEEYVEDFFHNLGK